MPWKTFLVDNQYCVFKLNEAGDKTGSSLGCHSTKGEANEQIAALNIAEQKEVDMPDEIKKEEMKEKATPVSDIVDDTYVPFGVISFDEFEALQNAKASGQAVKAIASQFQEMVNNIFMRDDVEDKTSAIMTLTNQLIDRMDNVETKEFNEESFFEKIVNKVKEAIRFEGKEEEEKKPPAFSVWYDKELKQYKWLAVYSNNIIDKEEEIIAAESHQNFVKEVSEGKLPLPELWLWHIKEWKWGEATNLAYDDSGFPVALGTVDRNEPAEAITKWLSTKDNILVSHGMPRESVERDGKEKSIIIRHQTREISPLPAFAAANQLTGFHILKEAKDMAIPQEKREELIEQGLPASTLDELEKLNADTSKEADEANLKRKETEEASPEPESVQQEESPVTRQEIADAIVQTTKPLVEQIQALTDQVKELTKAQAGQIPQASLTAMVGESLFGKETQVDGRSSLAKSKPKEKEADEEDDLFIRQLGWLGPEVRQ
jgi:hypothetical protein